MLNTLKPNTAYMRKKYCTCFNYLFLVLLYILVTTYWTFTIALNGTFCNYESKQTN